MHQQLVSAELRRLLRSEEVRQQGRSVLCLARDARGMLALGGEPADLPSSSHLLPLGMSSSRGNRTSGRSNNDGFEMRQSVYQLSHMFSPGRRYQAFDAYRGNDGSDAVVGSQPCLRAVSRRAEVAKGEAIHKHGTSNNDLLRLRARLAAGGKSQDKLKQRGAAVGRLPPQIHWSKHDKRARRFKQAAAAREAW